MSDNNARYAELDFLRGFAVLGIFQINIFYFGQPFEIYNFPTLLGQHEFVNALAWFYTTLFVEGTMYGLFSLLFGVSAMILLQQVAYDSPNGVAAVDRYYRRMLWLLFFGLLHAYFLLSPMEILYTYAVLGLFLFPLRNLSAISLVIIGSLLVVIGAIDLVFIEKANANFIDTGQQNDLYSSVMVDLNLYHSSYLEIFFENIGLASQWQTQNFFEDQLYDSAGLMLIGMALYKMGVITGQKSTRYYLVMSVMGYLAGFLLRWPTAMTYYQSGFDPIVFEQLPTGINLIGRIFIIFGHIGLLISLFRVDFFQKALLILAKTGKMALTHYLMQTLFAIFLFYGFGLGKFGTFERYQLLITALGFGLMQVLFSLVWLRYFYFGPLEWFWRSLIFKQMQPLKIKS